jgi:hypothetical protein
MSNFTDDIVSEGKRIVAAANEKEMPLRLMGAIAVRIHCQEFSTYLDKMNRVISDVDVIGLGKDRNSISRIVEGLGYEANVRANLLFGVRRHTYENRSNNIHLDVFFDQFEMCHTIDFKERLALDYPTITLADLLLEKMQIVRITEKDLQDMSVVFLEHGVGESREEIDQKYISRMLSSDWGFHYTVTTNLRKLKDFQAGLAMFSDEGKASIAKRIDALQGSIEEEPKSRRWRVREKIGTKRKWYNDVEELSDR